MAANRSAVMGRLASATKAPRSTAPPPSSSIPIVSQAIKWGAGTPSACRIMANVSGPLDSLATPCCRKPNPTIRRSGIGAQRAIGSRLNQTDATSRNVVMLGDLRSAALMSVAGCRNGGRERERRARKRNALLLEKLFDPGHVGADDSGFGDHQRLVPIADVVREQPPLLGVARLDDEHRLRSLDDDDDGLRVVDDQAVTAAQDRASRKGKSERDAAVRPPLRVHAQPVVPSKRQCVASIAPGRRRQGVLAKYLFDDRQTS